jgi:hypothetical protein
MTITRRASGAAAYSRSDCLANTISDDRTVCASDDAGEAKNKWSSIIDELLRIRSLEDDWDGEGTLAPNPALVDGAIKLATQLKGSAPPDRVHASVNATVYFEWDTPEFYREIEVVSPMDAELRFVRKSSEQTEEMRFYL